MASVVAAPPKSARVFGNPVLADAATTGDLQHRNGVAVTTTTSHNTVNHHHHGTSTPTTTSSLDLPDKNGVYVPPAAVTAMAAGHGTSNNNNIEGLGGSVYKPNGKEAEWNGKKMPVSFQTLVSGGGTLPEDENPKEQVWTALSKLESNSECTI